MRRERGFTIIEIMVSVILTGLVVSAVVGLYGRMSRNYDALNAIGDAQQNLRAVRTMLAREVRAAGANSMGMVMAGGRIWFPRAAECNNALPMAGPQMGCEFWLGFNFKDTWVDGGTSTLSDPIFVSYAVQAQQGNEDFVPQLVASVDAGPTFDGVTLDAEPPAELEVGDFAMLTNGYHACVVEITAVDVPSKRVDFAAGVGINPGNGLSDYCVPFQTSGPGAGSNTGTLAGGTYCACGGDIPERRCYLIDMQTIRLRRFYVWPNPSGDRELRLESAIGAVPVLGGAGADLLGAGVAQEILVRGMEDMQVSYKLREDNGSTPGRAFPNPPLDPAETGYQAAGTEFDYHTDQAGTCADGCSAACGANTSDCRGECVPGDGDCPANPASPQDEARWLDQVTITLLARTRSKMPGSLGGEAGLEALNADWGANQPAQASSYLRRTLRVEVDMRNFVRAW